MYSYRTKFGTFFIRAHPRLAGRWLLQIGDETLGSYHSPLAAADDVYCQATGYYEWDTMRPSPLQPTDLSEWQIHPGEP